MSQVLGDPVRVGALRIAVISDVAVHAQSGHGGRRFFCRKHPRFILIGNKWDVTAFGPDGHTIEVVDIARQCPDLLRLFQANRSDTTE